jgi:Fe-S-cluster containining protein
VEESVRAQIDGHQLTLRVIEDRGSAFRDKKPLPVLNMSPDNPRCGYLEDDLLCGLHRHIGVGAKPNTCRVYPFIISQTPDGYYVGLSFSCTAARDNSGRPIAVHEADLQSYVAAGTAVNVVSSDGLVVHGQWFTRWSDYLQFEGDLLTNARLAGYRHAIAEATAALASGLGQLPKPRTPSPRPLPSELLLARSTLSSGKLQPVVSELILELLPHLDTGISDEHVRRFRQGEEARLLLAPLGWEGSKADWEQQLLEPLPAHLQPELERYLEHLVFRKQLVLHPTLLANLVLFHSLPAFLALFARSFAAGNGVTLEHYHQALDVAEKYLVYHCRGLRPIYQKAARWAVERMRSSDGQHDSL